MINPKQKNTQFTKVINPKQKNAQFAKVINPKQKNAQFAKLINPKQKNIQVTKHSFIMDHTPFWAVFFTFLFSCRLNWTAWPHRQRLSLVRVREEIHQEKFAQCTNLFLFCHSLNRHVVLRGGSSQVQCINTVLDKALWIKYLYIYTWYADYNNKSLWVSLSWLELEGSLFPQTTFTLFPIQTPRAHFGNTVVPRSNSSCLLREHCCSPFKLLVFAL